MEFENTGIRFFSIGLVSNQDDGSRLEKYDPFVKKEFIKFFQFMHRINQAQDCLKLFLASAILTLVCIISIEQMDNT